MVSACMRKQSIPGPLFEEEWPRIEASATQYRLVQLLRATHTVHVVSTRQAARCIDWLHSAYKLALHCSMGTPCIVGGFCETLHLPKEGWRVVEV